MPRRYLALCGVVLVAALWAVWRFGYQGIDPRLIVWPPPDDAPPLAALDEPAELYVDQMPLDEVLKLLAEKHGVKIELDEQAIANIGVSPKTPITRHVSGVRLRSLLRLVLRDVDLTFGVRRGEILVTTDEEWEGNLSHFVARVYTIETLLAGSHPIDEQDLADILSSCIAPTTWDFAGGSGVIRAVPGAIIVANLPEVQDEVADVLKTLASTLADSGEFSPVVLHPRRSAREERILRALEEPTSVDALEQPLGEVAAELARRHGIPIQLNNPALAGVGVSSDTPVSRRVAGISLRSALALFLRDLDLTILVTDDVLLITTPEYVDRDLSTRLYPIQDLLDRRRGIEADDVIYVVSSVVAATTWADAGGAGSIEFIAGHLIVSQTDAEHESLENALANFRRAQLPLALAGPDIEPQPHPAEVKILAALEKSVSVSFRETPFNEVVEHFRAQFGIEIQLDIKALDSVGIPPETPVTLEVENVTLRAALRHILRELDLTFIIKDEVLQITTPEIADASLLYRWYRLQPLLSPAGWARKEPPTARDMVDLITSTVAPTTWDHAGGVGSIDAVGDALLVAQSEHVHEQVAGLLQELTRFKYSRRPRSPTHLVETTRGAYARHIASLQRPVDLEFKDTPLQDAVRSLSQQAGVPILLDVRALESIGLSAVTPVTVSARGVPLGRALEMLAKPEELSYHTRDDVLRLTTLEITETTLDTVLYDVRDLTSAIGNAETHLAELITGTIDPSTWDDAGGAGACSHFPGALVVSQTLKVHMQIERLLAFLRTRPAPDSLAVDLDTSGETLVRFYPVGDLLKITQPQLPRRPAGLVELERWSAQRRSPRYAWQLNFIGTTSSVPRPPGRESVLLAAILQVVLGRPEEHNAGAALWDDWLAVSADDATHGKVVEFLRGARRIMSREADAPGVGSPAGIYDLRPVLASFPELDERQIALWLGAMTNRLVWPDQPQRLVPLFPLPGMIAMRQTPDDHAQITACLEFLQSGAADFPRPYEFARDDNRKPIARLARLIETEQDPLRLGYALWLVLQTTPSSELAAAIVKRLAPADAKDDRREFMQLARAAAHCGPLAKEAIVTLVAQMERFEELDMQREATPVEEGASPPESDKRARWAENQEMWRLLGETLSALGPRGRLEFFRLYASAQRPTKENVALGDVVDRFGRADELLPTIVGWLDDKNFNQKKVILLISLLDPKAKQTREILQQWQAGDDKVLRERAQKILDELFRGPFPSFNILGIPGGSS